MIFQQTFAINGAGEVVDGGINIIPCSISSVNSTNNYQPTPLSGEAADAVIRKVASLSNVAGHHLDGQLHRHALNAPVRRAGYAASAAPRAVFAPAPRAHFTGKALFVCPWSGIMNLSSSCLPQGGRGYV